MTLSTVLFSGKEPVLFPQPIARDSIELRHLRGDLHGDFGLATRYPSRESIVYESDRRSDSYTLDPQCGMTGDHASQLYWRLPQSAILVHDSSLYMPESIR